MPSWRQLLVEAATYKTPEALHCEDFDAARYSHAERCSFMAAHWMRRRLQGWYR